MEFCEGGFITDIKYISENNISIDDVRTWFKITDFQSINQHELAMAPDNQSSGAPEIQ